MQLGRVLDQFEGKRTPGDRCITVILDYASERHPDPLAETRVVRGETSNSAPHSDYIPNCHARPLTVAH